MTKPLSAPSAAPAGEPTQAMKTAIEYGERVAGDAVPQTPEPDRGLFELYVRLNWPNREAEWRPELKRYPLASDMQRMWEAYQAGAKDASSVTAHKEAEIAQRDETIKFLMDKANEIMHTLGEAEAEVERLRKELSEAHRLLNDWKNATLGEGKL